MACAHKWRLGTSARARLDIEEKHVKVTFLQYSHDFSSLDFGNSYLFSSEELQCENEPCENGGTCTEMDKGFVCTCARGFRGKTCQSMTSSRLILINCFRQLRLEKD